MLGFDYSHFCGTESDFRDGAAFDPTVNVTYDADWIPDCCGRDDVCTFNLCEITAVNGRPAARLLTYPIPHQDATATTPVLIETSALNLGNSSPAWPGIGWEWKPNGADPVRQFQLIADDAGALQFQVDTWTFGAVDSIARTVNANGIGWDLALGGDVGGMALEFVGGVLTLSGTNLQVAKSILPADVSYRDGSVISGGTAAGPFAPAPIPPGAHHLLAPDTLHRTWRLEAHDAAEVDVWPTGSGPYTIYPPAGEQFRGSVVDAPVIIGTAGPSVNAYRFTRVAISGGAPLWVWTTYRADGTVPLYSAVTSVGISTSSTGVTVGGGPITTTGTLTVNLDGAIQDVVAMAAVDALVAGDGAGGLVSVAIGDYLTYSGGTLDVVPPTATSGQLVCAAYSITGTTGTFQATGNTFTLPAAGRYLVTGRIRGDLIPGAAGFHYITIKLRNNTLAADVANSFTRVCLSDVNGSLRSDTCGFTAVIDTTGSETIELYAARTGGPWALSDIGSDAGGYSVFDWVRLS